MSNELRFVVYALAVFRLTHLIWHENGPWDIVDWLRARMGVRVEEELVARRDDAAHEYEIHTVEVAVADGFFAKLVMCPWCVSGWLSVLAVVGFALNVVAIDVIATGLAMWSVSLLLFGWKRYEPGG